MLFFSSSFLFNVVIICHFNTVNTLDMVKIYPQTNKQTDKTNCLTPLRMRAQGKNEGLASGKRENEADWLLKTSMWAEKLQSKATCHRSSVFQFKNLQSMKGTLFCKGCHLLKMHQERTLSSYVWINSEGRWALGSPFRAIWWLLLGSCGNSL